MWSSVYMSDTGLDPATPIRPWRVTLPECGSVKSPKFAKLVQHDAIDARAEDPEQPEHIGEVSS